MGGPVTTAGLSEVIANGGFMGGQFDCGGL